MVTAVAVFFWHISTCYLPGKTRVTTRCSDDFFSGKRTSHVQRDPGSEPKSAGVVSGELSMKIVQGFVLFFFIAMAEHGLVSVFVFEHSDG